MARYIFERLLNLKIHFRQALHDAQFKQINDGPNCRTISLGDE
jgi:hypothetical protein